MDVKKATRCATMMVGIAVLGSSPLHAQSAESDSRDGILRVFERDFADGWRAADAEALASLWTNDGDWSSVVGSRRVVRGRAALAEIWATGIGGRSTPDELAIEIEVDHVRLLGDAHAVVDVVMTFATDTEAAASEAYVMVMTRIDGQWLIASARAVRLS